MDQFEWLRQDIKELKADVSKEVGMVRSELEIVKGDVKSLMADKWKIFGGAMVASVVFGVAAQAFIAYIFNNK